MSADPAPTARYPVTAEPLRPLVLSGTRLLPVSLLRVYTCGITPYDVTHVGHASTFVWADLLCSVARAAGARTHLVRNVTDVDDVLTAAAHRAGRHYDELAVVQEFQFDRDMTALGVARPDDGPHARAHVPAVVRLTAALLDADAAYVHESEQGSYVYFRGAGVPALARLDEPTALALSREYGDQDHVPGRASDFDVALWRPSADDQPAWPSPWGWGRPGWHAECAAMAVASLGHAIDVLVGGCDLAFPHHAYQQAMVEAATGTAPFARAVLHVGEVQLGGHKMAKSSGNLTLVSDLLERFPGPVLRLGLLDRPVADSWECDDAVFEAAGARLDQLVAAAGPPSERVGSEAARADVLAALLDGLDVPRAVEEALEAGPDAAAFLLDVLRLTR
ncbi:cysteine--tRNA ligase [Nocardioides acrostichi]|uniref:cysteine--tRNA ligase n=1 Tax=Nocardioides acrostichi TaxID=2784339 RepID=UPI002E2B16F5|nr:cysteine--tRNA ligase [Nocardioides acrostichi]